jgi:hypothetical protein
MNVVSSENRQYVPISNEVNPENLRIVVYLFFIAIVLVGFLVTRIFSEHAIHHNTLKDLWGYNNICVFFDHAPATYILPTLYSINLLFISLYFVSSWLRCRSECQANRISKRGFIGYTIITAYEFLSFCFFATVFAVSPDENLILHSVPFINLIIALSTLAAKNYWYHQNTMDLSPRQKRLGQAYVSIHVIVSLVYVFALINGFFGDPFYCTLCHETFHLVINRTWLVTGLLLPIGISIHLRNKEKNIVLTVLSRAPS